MLNTVTVFKKNLLAQFGLIFLIAYLVFLPSFHLALFGDDWLAFFRYDAHAGPLAPGQWHLLTYFLSPYGAQDILMGFLRYGFGYNSSLYYMTSFFLRMLAAFSLYPLIIYLTKNKLAAFFGVLFFAVTAVGLDTTNWVFNMPTYLTIGLLNIFLYLFLKARTTDNWEILALSVLVYFLAYVITPIRMHGTLPFLFLLESFWVFQEKNGKTLKKVALRFGLLILVFLVIKFSGGSLGPSTEIPERLNSGIADKLTLLSQGRIDFIFYPILMFGSMIIPDVLLPQANKVSSAIELFIVYLIPLFAVFVFFVFLLLKNIPQLQQKKLFSKLIIFSLGWTICVMILNIINNQSFSNVYGIILTLVGGYFFILGIFLIYNYFSNKLVSTAIFISIVWSILSFFFAWWWESLSQIPVNYPYLLFSSVFPTTYRYFTISAIGIAIFCATIISLGKDKRQQIELFGIFSVLIIFNIIATNGYLNQIASYRSQQIADKIWSSIPQIPNLKQRKLQTIFYFEGEQDNAMTLHDVITFGFPPHMDLTYNLKEADNITPVVISSLPDLASAVTDGKSLKAYGLPQKPFPISQIYLFHLSGKDNLIDITTAGRDQLTKYQAAQGHK